MTDTPKRPAYGAEPGWVRYVNHLEREVERLRAQLEDLGRLHERITRSKLALAVEALRNVKHWSYQPMVQAALAQIDSAPGTSPVPAGKAEPGRASVDGPEPSPTDTADITRDDNGSMGIRSLTEPQIRALWNAANHYEDLIEGGDKPDGWSESQDAAVLRRAMTKLDDALRAEKERGDDVA